MLLQTSTESDNGMRRSFSGLASIHGSDSCYLDCKRRRQHRCAVVNIMTSICMPLAMTGVAERGLSCT